MVFAKRYKNFTPHEWARVIWSDEARMNLHNPDGNFFVRRPAGTRYEEKYVKKTVKFNGGSIMVWGKKIKN